MIIDVKEIDKLRLFLSEEERYCRGHSGSWAEQKAAKLARIGEILLGLRRDKQMRGASGERIDG